MSKFKAWVLVFVVLFLLLVCGCRRVPVERFEYKMITYQPNGKTMVYTRTCDSHPLDDWCSANVLTNTRTLYLGDNQQLYCDFGGNLHLRMNGYGEQETFTVIPQKGVTCDFKVKSLGFV